MEVEYTTPNTTKHIRSSTSTPTSSGKQTISEVQHQPQLLQANNNQNFPKTF
jgi:hypothetical protein